MAFSVMYTLNYFHNGGLSLVGGAGGEKFLTSKSLENPCRVESFVSRDRAERKVSRIETGQRLI